MYSALNLKSGNSTTGFSVPKSNPKKGIANVMVNKPKNIPNKLKRILSATYLQ
jgi:hypothetical protein